KELGLLDRYLLGGGSVLVLLDPVELPHLEEWIASHGLRVVDDVVIDLANRVYGGDGTNVLVPYFRDHPAAKALGTPAVLGRARSVATLDGGEGASDAPVQVVARTTPESF